MKKILLLCITLLMSAGTHQAMAQPQQAPGAERPATSNADFNQLSKDIDISRTESLFYLSANVMNDGKREKLNRIADAYRSTTRGMLSDFGNAMLQGGMTGIVNVVGNEIINLLQIRSKQKRAWMEMRQRECLFVDSLLSVAGQRDFYAKPSSHGPLDPSDMQFDGITLIASRHGQEILNMVCHIDEERLDHIFLHSKFYLVIDSLTFYPYRSFLPNMGAHRINARQEDLGGLTQDERDYWTAISHFDFDEYQSPRIKVDIDLFSSWINDLAQVFHDVKLGSFNVEIPFGAKDLTDSVYVYSRQRALREGQPLLTMNGDCFVVPRSFMPVSIDRPSWGTGEYKVKMTFTEQCRYNPEGMRARDWRRDYKQLVKMQNHGKGKNEYIEELVTTFRDNRYAILKATYQPALTKGAAMVKIGQSASGMPAMGGSHNGGGAPGNKP